MTPGRDQPYLIGTQPDRSRHAASRHVALHHFWPGTGRWIETPHRWHGRDSVSRRLLMLHRLEQCVWPAIVGWKPSPHSGQVWTGCIERQRACDARRSQRRLQ